MKNIFYKFFLIITFLITYTITLNIENCSAQWTQLNGPGKPYVYAVYTSDSKMFAGTMQDGLYTSTNKGLNWTQFEVSWHNQVSDVTGNGSTVFFSSMNASPDSLNGVFRSTDNGLTWTQTLFNHNIVSLAVSGNTICAGDYFNGALYKSTDNGLTWEGYIVVNNYNFCIYSTFIESSFLLAGTLHGLFKSTNGGLNWVQTNIPNESIIHIIKSGNSYFAGTIWGSGIYRSDDNGDTWFLTSMHNRDIDGLVSYGNIIIASALDDIDSLSGIYISSDYGLSWLKRNEGYNSNYIFISLYINSNFVYGGLDNVWSRHLSELIAIKPISTVIPRQFYLSQNYPNPFNPTTSIRYELPKSGFVNLVVYDALGKELKTLVNEKQSAGTYEAAFNGSNYTSGVYFYRLTTENFSETKKMLLIK